MISRQEAIAAGLARYDTGKPCKRGHVAERFTSTCSCVVCSRDAVYTARDLVALRRHPNVRTIENLLVPTLDVPAILAMARAFMAARGFEPGNQHRVVDGSKGMSLEEVAVHRERIQQNWCPPAVRTGPDRL